MAYEPIVLEGFEGRTDALRAITRYDDPYYPFMHYRTNDYLHSQRVLFHLEEILPLVEATYGNAFDIPFARTLALVHDDVEIITGDVQLYKKEQMADEERNTLKEKEKQAIPILVERFSSIANGFSYADLLCAAKEKTRLEAQVVSYCDKFDGFGEAMHEIWAGNKAFCRPAGGTGANGGYIRRLGAFPELYPQLVVLLSQEHPLFHPKMIDFAAIAKKGTYHTIPSVLKPTGYAPYDCWKKTVAQREGVYLLTEVKETTEHRPRSVSY